VATNGAQLRYLTDTVSTATPARLIVMLYDRLDLDLRRASEAFGKAEPFEAAPHLIHAQQIIAELMTSLRTELWPEGEKLASLYGFLLRELIAINADADAERLAAVTVIVCGLRDTWAQAGLIVAQDKSTRDGRLDQAVSATETTRAVAWVG
jgi:flagellar protein FliS